MPTHFTGSRAAMRTLDTFIKLTRCTNSVLARLAEKGTVGDLTYSQFAVLEALYHLGHMSQGEISMKVLKSGSNMTTVIDNLERDGLVRRERDANSFVTRSADLDRSPLHRCCKNSKRARAS